MGRCVHEADEKWGGESKGADEKWGGESVTLPYHTIPKPSIQYREQINRKRSPSQDSDARYAEDTRSLLRRVDNAALS